VEWLKLHRSCANVQYLNQIYQDRIAVLTGSLSSLAASSNATSQSSQSSDSFYTGKFKLTKGGEFPVCNAIFAFLENPKNRAFLGQTVNPLIAIKGVTLPEWKEVSEEEYLKIIDPSLLTDPKAISVRTESKKKYPNWKQYRAKVNFDRESNAEYYVIKS
jgi:hypothetical protein